MLRPYPDDSSSKKTKKRCHTFSAQRSQTFLQWANSRNTVFFGIEEILTLTKFQGIYLSKAFLDVEVAVKEGAQGIEEEKKNPSVQV